MMFQVVGCSHHTTSISLRERLTFSSAQTQQALARWRPLFPALEMVLLSTCNRVELYAAADGTPGVEREQLGDLLAGFHVLPFQEVADHFYSYQEREAIRHLFQVACSLDSMVVGEPQILAQVKQAYQLATACGTTGAWIHAAFQRALGVARRVATETEIHQRRVSIPSVAVAEFAQRVFERFDDKHVVVIGAGEMAEETIRYLRDQGAHQLTVINRSAERAAQLAKRWQGRAATWDQLVEALATADLVVSTTGSQQPLVDQQRFEQIERARHRGPLFIVDLAVPRDFEPAIGDRPDVYLYSIDDLQEACARNRQQRAKQLPAALRIIEQETDRFIGETHRRAAGPVIAQLREGWQKPKELELQRLLQRLPDLDERSKEEIRRSFDRLINKLLHPPLESLRNESRHGIPHVLLDALSRLFQLKD